ncbi:MAG: T9SS type A sorting domain-containing protein, partial [bacterium]
MKSGQINLALITSTGFVDSINNRPANTMRIFGKIVFSPVSVGENQNTKIVGRFSNLEIYPNPFTDRLVITYKSPANECAKTNGTLPDISYFSSSCIKIYDVTGRLVKQWGYESATQNGGIRQSDCVVWDTKDNAGRTLPSGVYFVQLEARDYKAT